MLGAEDVTFKVPDKVKTPAIPNTALVDSCRLKVELTVTLKKLAVPFSALLPENVMVFAVPVKVPATSNKVLIENEDAVEILARRGMVTELKNNVPVLVMLLLVPLKVILLLVAVKLPTTDKLLFIVKLLPVVTVAPVKIVRLARIIPVPVMVLAIPDI